MKNVLLKIENRWNRWCDETYHRINDWVWSRKESPWEKWLLDRKHPDFVEYAQDDYSKEFKEYLKYDRENPDRMIPKYGDNLNRIWDKN